MVLHIKLSELKSKYNKTYLLHHQIPHRHQNFEKMKSYNERRKRNSVDIMR